MTGAAEFFFHAHDEAAQRFNIGTRTVNKAANVIDKGCKQLQQAVRDERFSGDDARPNQPSQPTAAQR